MTFFFYEMAAKAQKRAAWSRTILSPSACSFFMFVLYAWCACQVSCEGSECASYALGTQFETLQLARTVTKPAQTIAHRSLALRGAGGEQAGVSFTSCSAKQEAAILRLCGGRSETEDDDLPMVDFKIKNAMRRFNVSLRVPFQIAMGGHLGEERWADNGVWRFVSYTGKREANKLILEVDSDETLHSVRRRIAPLLTLPSPSTEEGLGGVGAQHEGGVEDWYLSLNERVPLDLNVTLREHGIVPGDMLWVTKDWLLAADSDSTAEHDASLSPHGSSAQVGGHRGDKAGTRMGEGASGFTRCGGGLDVDGGEQGVGERGEREESSSGIGEIPEEMLLDMPDGTVAKFSGAHLFYWCKITCLLVQKYKY